MQYCKIPNLDVINNKTETKFEKKKNYLLHSNENNVYRISSTFYRGAFTTGSCKLRIFVVSKKKQSTYYIDSNYDNCFIWRNLKCHRQYGQPLQMNVINQFFIECFTISLLPLRRYIDPSNIYKGIVFSVHTAVLKSNKPELTLIHLDR